MDAKALNEQIYQAALPLLEGHTVTDLVVGISLLAVELDHKEISVSYVIRDDLAGGCSIFPYGTEVIGHPAPEIAHWFCEDADDLKRGIGGAVINAASQLQTLEDRDSREHPFDLTVTHDTTVGMVGHIPPALMRLKPFAPKTVIFDKGKSAEGDPAEGIYPMSRQAELLPRCDIVMMSGTAVVNGTAASLFEMAKDAKDVVLVGASVPMIPAGYRGTSASVLAGSWWRHEDKDAIFSLITHAAGMQKVGRYMVKKSVRVRS